METLVQTGGGKRYTIARGSATKLNGFSDDWHKLVADMKQRASQARFELLDLNEDECLESPTLDRHCASRNPKGLYTLARTIRECDRLISVAPLATDPATGVALTLGNFWGIAPGSAYGYPKTKLLELGAPAEILCDLYLHQPSSFTVVGGSMAVEGEGDKPLRHNVVIAGRITTAVDAVAAAVMGFDPRKLPHLGLFEKRGFGIRDTDSIWTSGCELDAATRRFRRPSRWEES
jgi:uncharacterized protein (DUF362 family)